VRAIAVKSWKSDREMKQIVAIMFACIVGLQAIDLQCKFQSFDDPHMSETACKTIHVNITSRETITSVNGESNFDGSKYSAVNIWKQVVHFIPEGLGGFFPNLEELTIKISKLKKVQKEDLQQFPKLRFLDLHLNKIEFLPGDLLDANPELRAIAVGYNQISHVSHNLVTSLNKLEFIFLKGNKCIDEEYQTGTYIIDKSYNETKPRNIFKLLASLEESDVESFTADLIAKCPEPTQKIIRRAAAIGIHKDQNSTKTNIEHTPSEIFVDEI
jgi:hypothetical protein